jgi:2-polyprenyl-6-methoxyphenol hydroxylase-like FAD-dependent oxidoreductase
LFDVVIAGAGPVGLFLACELRLAKTSVLVLEEMPDPGSPLKRLPFGMRGLSAPALEAFYHRGLLEELAATGSTTATSGTQRAHWQQQARRPAGHFAGLQFFHDTVDSSKWHYRLPSGPATALLVWRKRHTLFHAGSATPSNA